MRVVGTYGCTVGQARKWVVDEKVKKQKQDEPGEAVLVQLTPRDEEMVGWLAMVRFADANAIR
jgi:hypothetical protein